MCLGSFINVSPEPSYLLPEQLELEALGSRLVSSLWSLLGSSLLALLGHTLSHGAFSRQ